MNHHKRLLPRFFLFTLSSMVFPTLAAGENHQSDNSYSTRYVDTRLQKTLKPDISPQDAKELANSVEFEVYVMNEESSSRSVFVSGAGVCNGFDDEYGVDLTNSTNNYIHPGDDSQYYGGITGASIYRKGEPQNVQYVPVYVINDPSLEKEIRERDKTQTKKIVKHHIDSNRKVLDKMICVPANKANRVKK